MIGFLLNNQMQMTICPAMRVLHSDAFYDLLIVFHLATIVHIGPEKLCVRGVDIFLHLVVQHLVGEWLRVCGRLDL